MNQLCEELETLGGFIDLGRRASECFEVDDGGDGPVYRNADFNLLGISVGNARSVGRFGRKDFHKMNWSASDAGAGDRAVRSLITGRILPSWARVPQAKNLMVLQVVDGENPERCCTISCEI